MSYSPEDDLPPEPINRDDFDTAEGYDEFMYFIAIRETEESDRWPN